MGNSMISVIVPIYHSEPYLDKCIESLVNQTYCNLEIILVDDGSPDNCPEICDEWAKKDNRIQVIHKENGGVSSARNAGLDAASGEYIGFVDGDDIIDNDFYEFLINEAEKNNADISACSFKYYNPDGSLYKEEDGYIDKPAIFSSEELLCEYYSRCIGQWVSFCNKIIKCELFNSLRFPQGRIFEDWTLAPMIYYGCQKACYTPVHKYGYIVHSGSAVRTETVKRYADCVSADYEHYQFFNSRGITDYNEQIRCFIKSDFIKCIKAYTASSADKKLLSDAFSKCSEICESKIIRLLYTFPALFHFLYKIKEKIK